MNWKRGITRIYLVLWFLWAAFWVFTVASMHVHHGRRSVTSTRRVSVQEYDRIKRDNDPLELFHTVTQAGDDSLDMQETREIGTSRLYIDPPIGLGDVLGLLAAAFLFPALLLMAFRWIVTGFRGSGTQANP